MDLRDRIFNRERFCLEEILESLAREQEQSDALVFKLEQHEKKTVPELDEQLLWVEEKIEQPNILLYEFMESTYYVYRRVPWDEEEDEKYSTQEKEEDQTQYGLFVPTGVIVRRVPQNVLGNGVLGRAFIHSNYIEILDRLQGAEYNEVLTHEVLHIMYPEKKELEIRQMTRNYLGNTIYN